jgi:type I restriction enzyme S subunit
MVSEKKSEVVPKLRFPEFLGSQGWKFAPLESIAERIATKNTGGEVVRVLTNSAERGVLDQRDYFDRDIATAGKVDGYYIVDAGDYVYNPRTSATAPVGPISRNNIGKGVMSPLYTVFRFAAEKTDFYEHFFRSTGWHSYVRSAASTGARHDRMSITTGTFMRMPVPTPSEAEQQRIADCLSALDELIAAQGRKVEALKTYKRGLTQQLFPREGETLPRLRFPGFRNAPEWKERTLRSICNRIMDGTHFSPKTKEGPRPYLTSKNIRNGHIDLSTISYISEDEHREIYARCPAKKGDVLLTKDGANTGNCAINTLDFEFSLLSSVAVLRGDAALVKQNFLYQTITSERTQSDIINSMSGQAITRITLEKLGNYVVSLPDLAEQQKISELLSFFDTQITAEADKFGSLKAQKKGLMQQLFPSLEELDAWHP